MGCICSQKQPGEDQNEINDQIKLNEIKQAQNNIENFIDDNQDKPDQNKVNKDELQIQNYQEENPENNNDNLNQQEERTMDNPNPNNNNNNNEHINQQNMEENEGNNNNSQDKYDNNNDQQENKSKISKIDYNKEVFELINKIRKDPQSFANDVEESIQNIQTKGDKLIYAGKVKVALKKGEVVFRDAIEQLNNTEPMDELEFNEDIAIEVPDNAEQMKDSKYFKDLVEERKATVPIDSYFKDLIKDPYTSVLLMIVDDSSGKSQGHKRNTLLGPEFTSMAVTNKSDGKTFCAYLTFKK